MDETSAADLDFQRALSSARLPSMSSEIAFHWNKVNMPDMVSDTSKHNLGHPDAMGCYTSAGFMYSRDMGQCVQQGTGMIMTGIEPPPPSLPSVFAPISDVCDFGAAYLCSQTVAPTGTVTDGPMDSFASILDMPGVGPMIPGSMMHTFAPSSYPNAGPGQMIPYSTMPIRPNAMVQAPGFSPATPAALAPGIRPVAQSPSAVPARLAPGVRPFAPSPSSVPAQLAPGVRPFAPSPSSVPAQLAPGVRPFAPSPSSVPTQLAPGVMPVPIVEPAYQTVSNAGQMFQWEATETGLNRFLGNVGMFTHTYK